MRLSLKQAFGAQTAKALLILLQIICVNFAVAIPHVSEDSTIRSPRWSVPVSASFGAAFHSSPRLQKALDERVELVASTLNENPVVSTSLQLFGAPSAKRRLQGAGIGLRVSYQVRCHSNCDDVHESMAEIASGGDAALTHAQALITSINDVATDFGFEDAVLSTDQDIAATITAPELVSIELPPAPAPCESESGDAADCDTGEAPDGHSISSAAAAFPFSSASDLDLTGTFLYAVNVGGGATTQGAVSFTSDTDTDGVTVTAQNHIPSWGGRNNFGSDDGLEDVLQSIRWSGYPNSVTMELTGLTVGTEYKLQMLFTEKCCTRGWDVLVDDEVIFENFSPQDVEGGINTMNTGAALSFDFIAGSDTITIVHLGNGGFPDNNPILDGFTLEVDPDAPAGHSISTAAAAFPFSSASDLDLTGEFLYAVNVGGGATTQGAVSFTSDTDTDGVTVTA
eukprot:SAG31_NODE_5407_length_2552_cov_2.547493_1_plen_453_part_01